MDFPEILTVDQAAELLQANRTTVMDYCRAGKIPARKVGKSWRICKEKLMAWMGEEPVTVVKPAERPAQRGVPASVKNNPYYQKGALA
jgi:excisionase family DNA binding protein